MKVAIACGGTGGHIFPGLATASVLRARGHDVELWLAGKDVEAQAVKDFPGRTVTVRSEGLPSGFSWRGLRAGFRILGAVQACKEKMRGDRPAVLLAMGSYASVGPVLAARRLGVPVVLHEANVVPGRAIQFLSRYADEVAASFEETRFYLRPRPVVVTGLPLREELTGDGAGGLPSPLEAGRFTFLVVGGSRGAHRLNNVVASTLCSLAGEVPDIQVAHLTGVDDEQAVATRYEAGGVTALVRAFTPHMAPLYRSADLAICRAGASTCAELTLFRVPALLVPYPFAAKDHQTANARAMEKRGAADVVAEKDLTETWLADYLRENLASRRRLQRMREAHGAEPGADGARALADIVERVGRGDDAAGEPTAD